MGSTRRDPTVDSDVRSEARRGLAMYFSFIVAFEIVVCTWAIARPQSSQLAIAVLMFTPAVSSIATRLIRREGFGDVSFRLGGRRSLPWYGLALVLPIVVGAVAYGIGWATGLVGFVGTVGSLTAGIGLILVTAVPLTCITTAGEEIGWRGYMLTRLIDSGVPRPVLASGLIWGVWHLPMVFAGFYAGGESLLLSAALLLVSITATSVVYARMRLETGSVWPVVLAHSAWNMIIQNPFDHAASGPGATLWVGEAGIVTAAVLVVVAVLVSRGPWADLRRPPRTDDRDTTSLPRPTVS
ncbi:CPBP family glutamic-type intramembrane protease [Actinomycetospora sp. CA-053990]|uniref:CPBP family glutamic-type intramembrane protease n=1 Tax=Actinomycetospora sp. CA-053990 TaxID=3239891 RepID=UPI003D917FA0